MNFFKKIVFWEPTLTPHKLYFMHEIANLCPHITLVACADQGLSEERKLLGWENPAVNNIHIIISPLEHQIIDLCCHEASSTLHVFSGIRWFNNITKALRIVLYKDYIYSIMSEPRVIEGFKGKIRFIQSIITERKIRKSVSLVFAIGHEGVRWFNRVGYNKNIIFPFAYFVPPPKTSPSTVIPILSDRKIQVGYIGRLTREKGILEILEGCSSYPNNFELSYFGIGPDEVELKKRSAVLQIVCNIKPPIKNNLIGDFISRLDVLVLASTTKDGWGVIVSEALMCGIPVVVSDCVGASIILENPLFGRKVPPRSSAAITKAILSLQESGSFSNETKVLRKRMAIEMLSANAGAKYFLQILKWKFEGGNRPTSQFLGRV
jgi:glycosyltransferase involved in cell wall biosynthesis